MPTLAVYDVEIAKRIAEGLGKKLVIVPTSWDGLIPALQSGKLDAIIAGMSPLPNVPNKLILLILTMNHT